MRFFVVVPAGGVGSRLGAASPKQYLEVAGRPMITWSIAPFLAADWIERVVVVVAAEDARIDAALGQPSARCEVARVGGATRRDSVLNGLAWLSDNAKPDDDDFVLVHDAARPGLDGDLLQRLRDELVDHPVGGLLALPVVDTVKRADAGGQVLESVPRERLWLAQTPQMFRFGMLWSALAAHPDVTDEAGAIEAAGRSPQLVEGAAHNFKVTGKPDLRRMDDWLARVPHRPTSA